MGRAKRGYAHPYPTGRGHLPGPLDGSRRFGCTSARTTSSAFARVVIGGGFASAVGLAAVVRSIPMELFLASVLFLLFGALLGAAAGVVGVSVLIVRAASRAAIADPSSPAAIDQPIAAVSARPEAPQEPRGAAPGGDRAETLPHPLKVRPKPRCAFCETVRAALFASGKKLASK